MVVAKLLEIGVSSKRSIECVATGSHVFTLPVLVLDDDKAVETWWPIGYGKQPLYHLSVSHPRNRTLLTLYKAPSPHLKANY